MQFRGKLLRGGRVFLPGLTGTLAKHMTAGGTASERGTFTALADAGIAAGDDFVLELDDGRACDIRVVDVDDGDVTATVHFERHGVWH